MTAPATSTETATVTPLRAAAWRPAQPGGRLAGLLYRASRHLKLRVIRGDPDDETQGAPYLERYFLFRLPTPWGPVTGYLHRFVGSDPARGVHDHPWARAASLVLAGGYDEERLAGFAAAGPIVTTRRVRPGRLNLLRGTDFHRVVLRPRPDDAEQRPVEAWSLFVHSCHVKPWGFLKRGFALKDRDGRGRAETFVSFSAVPGSGGAAWWRDAPTGAGHPDRQRPPGRGR